MDEKLDVSHRCMPTAQKAIYILGCIKTSMGSRAREGILPLCSGETPLGVRIQLWSPQHKKDTELLEKVQRRATKMRL